MKTQRKQPPRKQPPRKAKFPVESVPIKRKQKIKPRIVSTYSSSNSPSQLRTYSSSNSHSQLRTKYMACQTSREDFSGVDGETSCDAASLPLPVKAGCNKESQEQQKEQEEQQKQEQTMETTGSTKWSEAERQALFTYIDSVEKIKLYFKNKPKFTSETATGMAATLGCTVSKRRVRRKLEQIGEAAKAFVDDKDSNPVFLKELRKTLCAPASSSQSQPKRLRSSKSESVQISSKSKTLASDRQAVSEALSQVSQCVPITNEQRIKYGRALFDKPDLHLAVFNSYDTLEEKIDFLNFISDQKGM